MKAVIIGSPKPRRSSSTEPGICQRLDHFADVVNAQPVLGNEATHQALVRALPAIDTSLEIRQVLLRGMHSLGFVLDGDIDHAVRHLHGHRADLLRPEDAEPAALDHGWAAHADVRVFGGDNHVAAAQQGGVAGEAATGIDPDDRHQPAEPAQLVPSGRRQPAAAAHALGCAARATGVAAAPAGAASAPLGEVHHRRPQSGRYVQHAVLHAVVHAALRAGEYCIVVGQHDAPRLRLVKQVAVDVA